MHAKAGRLVAATLQNYAVTCIFGMEDPIEIFHGLDRNRTRIVTIRDEKHGAIMAHGYAQATGRVGVCTSTFGPGASNLVTGLLEALQSSVPVLALVQDHPISARGRNAASELDHAAALAPYVKAVLRIDFPEQAPDRVRKALRIATSGRPGPVAILCPTDVMSMEAEADVSADDRYATVPALRPRANGDDVADAAKRIVAAQRAVIVAGGGTVISGAFREIEALAEHLQIPVATTMTGKGAIREDHPLSAGVLGLTTGGRYGHGKIPNALLEQADVAILLGSRTGQLCYNNWKTPKAGASVIHVDIDPIEFDRNFATAVPLAGDVRETLRDLLEVVRALSPARKANGVASDLSARRAEWLEELAPVASSSQSPMRPERVLDEINRTLSNASLIVTDASYSTGWAMNQMRVRQAGRFILSPRGTAGIGWGFAAAIGAKLGDPDRDVVCITGDGGFGYMINELETAARYRADLIVVVFNNGTLGFQRHWEEKALGSYLECDFLDVDYSDVARSLKAAGERVTNPDDLAAAIARGRAYVGPYVIDAVIDPEATAPISGFDRPLADGASH